MRRRSNNRGFTRIAHAESVKAALRRRSNHRGFTLLELLLALPLAVLVLSALLLLLRVGIGSFESGQVNSDAHYALRHARGMLIEDIVGGQSCAVLTRAGGAEVNSGQSGSCLRIARVDERGQDYTIYYYTQGQQFYRVENGTKTPVAEQFDRAEFTMTASGLVGVELSAGAQDYTYYSRFKCGRRTP